MSRNAKNYPCVGISIYVADTALVLTSSMQLPQDFCLNPRAKRNRVFKGLANWGKSSVRWYFGFKLHLIINEEGEIISFMITPANVDDRKPVPEMTKNVFGKLFGEKGYICHQII